MGEFHKTVAQWWNDPLIIQLIIAVAGLVVIRLLSAFGQTAKGVESLYSQFKENIRDSHFSMIKVSPQLGAAVLLNHAILACHNFGLTPLTENELYERLLLNKFRRAARSSIINQYKAELQMTSSIMAKRVMELNLPKLKMHSFLEVLEMTEKLSDELLRFQSELTKFATQVQAEPYDDKYQKEIERIVIRNVNPAVEEIRAKLKVTKRRLISKIIQGAKTGTVPIVAALFAGILLQYVLALSAGVIDLEAWWEMRCARSDVVEQNSLSFLLKVS